MEPEGSLLHSQKPTTCPYSGPGQSSQSHLWYNLKKKCEGLWGYKVTYLPDVSIFFEQADTCR